MSTKFKRLLSSSLCVVFLFGTGLLLSPLQQMRRDYDLAAEPVKGLSPKLALAVQALGWGRGLIIDVIWIRMESLKRQHRFFELVQLANWACTLAPNFPQVWDVQSWNLAYNVSAKVEHLPDRWAWVCAGIELLRDEGIPMNPHSAMLYDRLAWLYMHKIGGQDDNAHLFYKQMLGLLMHEVLGGEGDRETLVAFAEAPATREELLEDEGVNRLWTECGAQGFDIVEGYFEVYKRTESVPPAVRQIVTRPDTAEALHKVQVYARATRLREELKLDPQKMIELVDQYGPFDWRTAFPHAIYWATIGLERLDELERRTLGTLEQFGVEVPTPDPVKDAYKADETLYEFRRVTLRRIVYASIQSLVSHGRLLFDTKGRFMLEAGSDYRFADAALPLYEEVIEAHGIRFRMGTQDAYKHFLRRGVTEFYMMGNATKSHEYFNRLKEKFPEEVKGRSFDAYRRGRLKGYTADMTTGEVRNIVAAYLNRALFNLGCNADEKALVLEEEAKALVKQWNLEAEPNLRGTVRFDRLREAVVTDLLSGRGPVRFPREVVDNVIERLKERTDDGVVQRVLQRLEAAQEGLLEPEEVEEQWRMETR